MNVQELARQSAATIRARGWNNDGWFENCDGGVCVMGAVRVVLTGKPTKEPAGRGGEMNEIRDAIRARVGGGPVTDWNDTRSSVDEVLAVLDSIANDEGKAA